MRQVLLSSDVVMAARTVFAYLADRPGLESLARGYKALVRHHADELGVAEQVAMTSRLGPVAPGMRSDGLGRQTLDVVFSAAVLHAAVADHADRMEGHVLAHHTEVGHLVHAVDELTSLLTDDPTAPRVAVALAPTWNETLSELTSTIRAVTAAA